MANLINLNVAENCAAQNKIYWTNQSIYVVSLVALAALGIGAGVAATAYGTFWLMPTCMLSFHAFAWIDNAYLSDFRQLAVRAAKEHNHLERVAVKLSDGETDVLAAQTAVHEDKIQNAQVKITRAQEKADEAATNDNLSHEIQYREYVHLRKEQKLLPHKIRMAYLSYLDENRTNPRPLSEMVANEMPKSLQKMLIRHEYHQDDVYLVTCDGRHFNRADLLSWSVDQIKTNVFTSHAA